jgi:DNA-binding NtrC family response regulator
LRAQKFSRDCTATVLIEGEAGTGKTLLARRIHEMSPRNQAPFRSCVLSALDDTLASDELFGHVAGAFTGARGARTGAFASAAGGTVFLDEIGKASLHVQQKLLDVIESHVIAPLGADRQVTVDVRIIAAANIPLRQLVEKERFLADLYARLKSFRISLPSLRERAEDIPSLVEQCLARHAEACGYESPPDVDDQLMAALRLASWPDNLRELDGTVHRLLVEAEGAMVLTPRLCVGDLSFLVARRRHKQPLQIEEARQAMAETGNKKAPAARLLGVSRWTVDRVLRQAEAHAE